MKSNLKSDYIWEKIEKGVFVIAEIGKNFIQSKNNKTSAEYLKNAKNLIKLAKNAGADAVKFQTHNLEDEQVKIKIFSPHFSSTDRYNWVKRNSSITTDFFLKKIKEYCRKIDIIFFSTPMSRGAAIKLEKIDIPIWKVGSADILDFALLDYISKTGKPIIISSGMSKLNEIDAAVKFLKKRNCKIALLYCISKYPCSKKDINLAIIDFFKKRYNIPIGFSDHSIDYSSSLAAINRGATIIEKHFSLTRDLWGPDHKVSLTFKEFKEMTDKIKNNNKQKFTIKNKKIKFLLKSEKSFRPFFRKSLVAARNIKRGEILTKTMIYAMRPQGFIRGLESEKFEEIIGKRINKNIKKYDAIKEVYLK